jgi:hypothetical protein
VNGWAGRPEVTVILLHVSGLHGTLAPENGLDVESGEEIRWHLWRLAEDHIHPIASTLVRVRVGEPAREILAEASAERVDLIVLPAYGPSLYGRLAAFWRPVRGPRISALAVTVIREAACGVFIVDVKTRFDCRKAWGRPTASANARRGPAGIFAGAGRVLPARATRF